MPAIRLHIWWWVAGAISLAVLVATAAATGLLTPQTPPGLPTAPPIATWALPVMQLLRDGAGIIAVGFVLVGGLLAPQPVRRFLHIAAWWCVGWLIATAVHAVLMIADVFALPISTVLEPGVISVFITDTIPGRVAGYQVVAVAIATFLLLFASARRWRVIAFALVMTAVAAPAFSGHAGLGSGHESATASLGLHIGSLAAWIGGLIATTLYVVRGYPSRDVVVRRFSAVALWCVVIAVETGLINASLRLPTWEAMFTTTYGQVVLAKATILALLIWFGWTHRRRTIPELTRSNMRPFVSLALVEVGIMAVALALSVVLARTNPDAPTPVASPGISLFWIAVLGTALVTYIWVFQSARRDGHPWPWIRLVAAVAAFVVLVIATSETAGSYADISFGLHVLQTTLLTFAAPALVITAVPQILTTRIGRWLRTYPDAIAIALVFIFYLVIFSPFYDILMGSHEGHLIMQLALLASGLAFVVAVVDRSRISIAIPMVVWPAILIWYPSPQALANVLVTELLLVVLMWRTWFHLARTVEVR